MTENTRILYVEDEDSIRMMTERILIKRGAVVTVAKNGQEGLERATDQKFDIIISDIQMPIMNGIEMIKKLKEMQCDTPTIITSAHNEPEYLKSLNELGVDIVIHKPIELKKLLLSIDELIDKNSQK